MLCTEYSTIRNQAQTLQLIELTEETDGATSPRTRGKTILLFATLNKEFYSNEVLSEKFESTIRVFSYKNTVTAQIASIPRENY